MTSGIKYLKSSKHRQLESARSFPTQEALSKEKMEIDKMDMPKGWKWIEFINAGRGAYIQMWRATGTNERPSNWNGIKAPPRFSLAFDNYLGTSAGTYWLNTYRPWWVNPPSPPSPPSAVPPVPSSPPPPPGPKASEAQTDCFGCRGQLKLCPYCVKSW